VGRAGVLVIARTMHLVIRNGHGRRPALTTWSDPIRMGGVQPKSVSPLQGIRGMQGGRLRPRNTVEMALESLNRAVLDICQERLNNWSIDVFGRTARPGGR
jgi:hypothetical protein